MPLTDVSYVDKPTGEAKTGGWSYAAHTNFDWDGKNARIVYITYASRTAAFSGLPPVVDPVVFLLGPTPTADLTVEEEIAPAVPPVLGPPDPISGAQEVITPGVPAVTQMVVLSPGMPGLPELVAQYAAAYQALLSALDDLALSRPEFAGAQKEVLDA